MFVDFSFDFDTTHDCYGTRFGQNLVFSVGWEKNLTRLVDLWVKEMAYYDYETQTCSHVCGHYTQIVWADTTKVTCCAQTPPAAANASQLISYNPRRLSSLNIIICVPQLRAQTANSYVIIKGACLNNMCVTASILAPTTVTKLTAVSLLRC